MPEISRIRILDVPVDAVDMATALDFVDRQVATARKPGYILAVNPEKVIRLRRDAALRQFFEEAVLLIPDGIGVVLAMRLLHRVRVERVAGATLMQKICERSARKGHRVFIYGAAEDVNRNAVAELERRHPELQIVGRANGYVPDSEMPALIRRINDSEADILFVALGSPRQENWIRTHSPTLRVKIFQGIGGTLDTICGVVKRAPKLFRRLRLEWFYRLVTQPSRARRQAVLPVFAGLVLQAWITGRK